MGKEQMRNDDNHQYFLQLLGAKGRHAATTVQVNHYKQIFKRLDADGDGRVTFQDYFERSIFNDPAKIRGIFNATDRNDDGIMTEEEYVENRTITDEAKEIFNKIDGDGDGVLTEKEFVDNSNILDQDLARQIFRELDVLDEGKLSLPAYLKIWGNWARED